MCLSQCIVITFAIIKPCLCISTYNLIITIINFYCSNMCNYETYTIGCLIYENIYYIIYDYNLRYVGSLRLSHFFLNLCTHWVEPLPKNSHKMSHRLKKIYLRGLIGLVICQDYAVWISGLHQFLQKNTQICQIEGAL